MLYDDERIKITMLSVGVADYAASAYDYAVSGAQVIRDEYEAQLAQQAAEIERLRTAVAGTWQPIFDENAELIDENADDDRRLYIHDCGESIEFTCESGELEGWFSLPAGYAVCRWNRTADDDRADRLTKELFEDLGSDVVLYKVS